MLAYTGCRVGELARLTVGSYKQTGADRVLEVQGKGGKERRVPLHAEAVERLEEWLEVGTFGMTCPALFFVQQKWPADTADTALRRGRSDGVRYKKWWKHWFAD